MIWCVCGPLITGRTEKSTRQRERPASIPSLVENLIGTGGPLGKEKDYWLIRID
jgi:hypothetical protein